MVESNKMKFSFSNLDRIYVVLILFCNNNNNKNNNNNNNNKSNGNNNNMSEMSNKNFESNGVNGTTLLGKGSLPGRCFLLQQREPERHAVDC